MRLRDETLKTGSLLACFPPDDREGNSSLLFLVRGAEDVEVLELLLSLKDPNEGGPFSWHTIADTAALGDVDPLFRASNMLQFEVQEFAGLSREAVKALLSPLFLQMEGGHKPSFPVASEVVGSIAKGIHFLNREKELEQLATYLREPETAVLLVAPRRSGKSSLLYRLMDTRQEEYQFHYMDLEDSIRSESVAAKLRSHVFEESFRKALGYIKQYSWESALSESLKTFQAKKPNSPSVLMLDELVYFLQELSKQGQESVIVFLKHLGQACQESGTRLVISGSIDLVHYITEELSLPISELPAPFDTMKRFVLGPMDSNELETELRRLLFGLGLVLEDGDIEWVLEYLDLALPFPTMKFLDELSATMRQEREPFTEERFRQCLDDFVEETDAFAELEKQLEMQLTQSYESSSRIEKALDRLIRKEPMKEGILRHELLQLLADSAGGGEIRLQEMMDTFPLLEKEERVFCTSRLFRHWWCHYWERA